MSNTLIRKEDTLNPQRKEVKDFHKPVIEKKKRLSQTLYVKMIIVVLSSNVIFTKRVHWYIR